MSLEEQIRRMGDTRATQVATSDWSGARPDRRWGRWALAGAAALVLLAGLAIVLADDGDDDTETVGDTDAGELTRWIPASGVTGVDYPGAAAWFPQIYGFAEVALIAPDGDATADPQTFIRVLGGSSPFQGTTSPAVSYRIHEHDDGLLELDLTDDAHERTVASIETSVFTEAELESLAPSLLPISADMPALAELLAGQRPDLAVVYVGDPVRFDRTIYGEDPDFDDGVLYLDTKSTAHYAASLGQAGRDEVTAANWIALESLDDLLLTDEVLGLDGDDAPVVVSEDEWLRILTGLIGEDPVVAVAGSEAFAMEDVVPDLADPPAEAVRQGNHWTVALRFAEPTTIRDGGGFTIRVGDAIEIDFGLAEPGVEFAALTSPSRMTRAEAQMLVAVINAGDGAETTDDQDDVTLTRWIPVDGVTHVAFPGNLLGVPAFIAEEVALITHGEEWTTIRRRPFVDPADLVAVSFAEDRGRTSAAFTGGPSAEEYGLQVITTKFGQAELAEREAELLSASASVSALAAEIASWDSEADITYVGPPAPIDATINLSTEPGNRGAVGWFREESAGQFDATYGPDGEGLFTEFFGLDDEEHVVVEDDHVVIGEHSTNVESVTESEWNRIVDMLLGETPRVEIELPETVVLAVEPAATRRRQDGHWTVTLQFDERATLDRPIEISIGSNVALWFGTDSLHESIAVVRVDSRLTEFEAERYATAINRRLARE